MRLFFFFCSLFSLAQVIAQQVIIDSKEYQVLKAANNLNGAALVAPAAPAVNQHFSGSQDQKTGLCDCLIPLDSTFQLAMLPNDDQYSNSIALPFTFSFYGTTYDSLYINNNGNISFSQPYFTFTAYPFPDPTFNMIAPVGVNIGNGINYFQVGQFDTAGVNFDGPYNTNDQVDFLDGQEIYFDLANTNSNIPPLIMSSGICDTIDVYTGDTLKSLNAVDFTIGISTPEIGQILTTNITCDEPNALSYQSSAVSNEFTSFDLTFDATGVQPGLYHIQIETTDNGIPAQTVTKNIPIRVVYDANLAGTNEMDIARIGVYPNPTSETIQISGLQANELLELFDGSGRLIQTLRVTKSSEQLSLPQVGFYILKCSSENRPLTVFKLQRI